MNVARRRSRKGSREGDFDKHCSMFTIRRPENIVQDVWQFNASEERPWGLFTVYADYFSGDVYNKALQKGIRVICAVTKDGNPYAPVCAQTVDAYHGPNVMGHNGQAQKAAFEAGLIQVKLPDTLTSEYYRWYIVEPPTEIEMLAEDYKDPTP